VGELLARGDRRGFIYDRHHSSRSPSPRGKKLFILSWRPASDVAFQVRFDVLRKLSHQRSHLFGIVWTCAAAGRSSRGVVTFRSVKAVPLLKRIMHQSMPWRAGCRCSGFCLCCQGVKIYVTIRSGGNFLREKLIRPNQIGRKPAAWLDVYWKKPSRLVV